MVWNCSIIAVALLFIVFRKNKAFGNESKTIGEKAERSNLYPAYTGSILSLVGVALALRNLLSVITVFCCCIICYQIRITVEETVLENRFGDEYTSYKHNTYKLFPFVF